MVTPSHQAMGEGPGDTGLAKKWAFSRWLVFPVGKTKEHSIHSNTQLPPQEKDCLQNKGLPLISRKMWSAACKGVSPSVREMLRGSAPLVKRRKASSKSPCFRHMASGCSWLPWRPSGEAGGGREKGPVSSIPEPRSAGPTWGGRDRFCPLFQIKRGCWPDFWGPPATPPFWEARVSQCPWRESLPPSGVLSLGLTSVSPSPPPTPPRDHHQHWSRDGVNNGTPSVCPTQSWTYTRWPGRERASHILCF